ncbi:MAG: DUF5020 family protein [Bacteroidales bacterium]|nr:DUF5020 family protein [Bacteroidales bacterium]
MRKKLFFAAFAAVAIAQGAMAQTNIQLFYDFGKDRKQVTGTIEGFHVDNWGNTFFFADFDAKHDANVPTGTKAPTGTYLEIARCLNFWQDTNMGLVSLQVEYNGGVYRGYHIPHALLVGADVFLHSQDFSNTYNFKLLYKKIAGVSSKIPVQFTFVWGMQDIFDIKGLRFSGFADFWFEDHTLFCDETGTPYATPQSSPYVFISEPQLWYNVGQFIGVPNFHLGGEVELSYDFGSTKGFWARPCLGAKWVF